MNIPTVCATPFDVVVIGAGISGLVAASALLPRVPRVLVLEVRNRVGGRLYSTQDGMDLGASWWWSHDTSAAKLAQKLGVASVPQHVGGNAWLHRGQQAQRVGEVGDQIVPSGPGSKRFVGGYAELPRRLADSLPDGTVQLGVRVVSLEQQDGDGSTPQAIIRVGIEGREAIMARRVILAIPPRLASRISYSPALPAATQRRLESTAAWCGDWSKVVATFKTPFWRQLGDSGVASTPNGLVEVWWEASGGEATSEAAASLAGLAFGQAGAARLGPFDSGPAATADGAAALRSKVISALGALYGEELVREQLLTVAVKVWMVDPDTYAPSPDGIEPPGDPRSSYGHPNLRTPTTWGVHFAGTESEGHSGHVAGAILAGERAAREVVSALEAQR